MDIEKDLSGKVVLVEEVLKQELGGLEGQKFGVEEQLRQLDEVKLRQLWKTGHWWNSALEPLELLVQQLGDDGIELDQFIEGGQYCCQE